MSSSIRLSPPGQFRNGVFERNDVEVVSYAVLDASTVNQVGNTLTEDDLRFAGTAQEHVRGPVLPAIGSDFYYFEATVHDRDGSDHYIAIGNQDTLDNQLFTDASGAIFNNAVLVLLNHNGGVTRDGSSSGNVGTPPTCFDDGDVVSIKVYPDWSIEFIGPTGSHTTAAGIPNLVGDPGIFFVSTSVQPAGADITFNFGQNAWARPAEAVGSILVPGA